MKGKFSLMWRVAVALVLVLSFSLVAAVPVSANPGSDYEVILETGDPDNVAEWSTEKAYAGSYSVKVTGYAKAVVTYGETLSTFEAIDRDKVLFNFVEPTTSREQRPYAQIFLDTTGNGEVDAALCKMFNIHKSGDDYYNHSGYDEVVKVTAGEWVTCDLRTDPGDPWTWQPDAYTVNLDAGTFTGAGNPTVGGITYPTDGYKTLSAWAAIDAWGDATVMYVGYSGYDVDSYVDDITIGTKTYELDPARVVDGTGTLLPTVADASSFYVHVTSPASNVHPAAVDTLTASLNIYDGVAIGGGCVTPISTTSYTATETGKDTSEFWTDAISTTDLGVRPGYKLVSSWEGGSLPVFIRAEVSFDKTYYDVGDSMTITIKDDTANISAIEIDDLGDIANAEIGWWDTPTTTWTGLTATISWRQGWTLVSSPTPPHRVLGDSLSVRRWRYITVTRST